MRFPSFRRERARGPVADVDFMEYPSSLQTGIVEPLDKGFLWTSMTDYWPTNLFHLTNPDAIRTRQDFTNMELGKLEKDKEDRDGAESPGGNYLDVHYRSQWTGFPRFSPKSTPCVTPLSLSPTFPSRHIYGTCPVQKKDFCQVVGRSCSPLKSPRRDQIRDRWVATWKFTETSFLRKTSKMDDVKHGFGHLHYDYRFIPRVCGKQDCKHFTIPDDQSQIPNGREADGIKDSHNLLVTGEPQPQSDDVTCIMNDVINRNEAEAEAEAEVATQVDDVRDNKENSCTATAEEVRDDIVEIEPATKVHNSGDGIQVPETSQKRSDKSRRRRRHWRKFGICWRKPRTSQSDTSHEPTNTPSDNTV